jgi:hypothetical protein
MSLLGARDTLTVITIVQAGSSDADAQALLQSFSDVVASQQVKRKAVCQVCANTIYQRCILLPVAPHSSSIMLATCMPAVSVCFTYNNYKKPVWIASCGPQLDKLVDTMVAEIALVKADLVVVGSQVLSDMKVRVHK